MRGGYSVKIITLPRYNMFHVETTNGKIILFDSVKNAIEEIIAANVYAVFAAPTCTMFSLARTTAKTPRDFNEGLKLVRKCLDVIWYCRAAENSCLKFWAIENPVGYLRQFLGKPALSFNPCDYGDNYTKKTDIWGYFNLPSICKKQMTEEEIAKCKTNSRELPKLPEDYVMPDSWNETAARRSMTSQKFAEAFYKANK